MQQTVETAKVRFTDVRDDAVDNSIESAPVRDNGVMLIVDKFDGTGTSQLELPVTVYNTEDDQRQMIVTVVATPDGASVTAASPPPSG